MVRSLRPSSNTGIIIPHKEVIKLGGQITAYTRPTPALQNIDSIIKGNPPRLAITRRQGGGGDVLMTTPTVRAISKKYKTKIVYGTDFDYLDGMLPKILQDNPYISDIVPWRTINPEEFNAVVELTCPCVAHEQPLAKPINRVDLFARHAGIFLEDFNIDYYITDAERRWASEYLTKHNLDMFTRILIQPSSSTINRDCPHSKVKDALQQILQSNKSIRAIVITHDSDNMKSDWNYSDIHKLNNKDVRQIAAIMEQCQLVICPDSAILHLAAALHKKTVTIFGPTDARARVDHHPEAVAIWPAGHLKNFPCVAGNSLVLTREGYKEIEQILQGDYVKVVDGTYQKVLQVHKNPIGERSLFEITCFGTKHRPIQATEDHKFLVSKNPSKVGRFQRDRYTPHPEWIGTKDIHKRDFLCIPRNKFFEDSTDFNSPENSPEAWWLYGLYLAEGFTKRTGKCNVYQVIFAGNVEEESLDRKVKECLKVFDIDHHCITRNGRKKNYSPCNDNQKAILRIVTNKRFFNHISDLFGRFTKATTKKIPIKAFNLPDAQLFAFLRGYSDGDGHEYEIDYKTQVGRRSIFSTSSQQVAYGIQELLTRFGVLGKVYRYKRDTNLKKDTIIFRIDVAHNNKKVRHLVDDNYIYVPVLDIEKTSRVIEEVYDLTVQNNTTFTVNNLATWDCWFTQPPGYEVCWKLIDPRLISGVALSLLLDSPLPYSTDLVSFGNYQMFSS